MEKWDPVFRVVGVGFYIGTCIVGGIVLGWWLDNKFNTAPVLLMVFLVLGLIASIWGVYQMLLPIIKRENKR